MKRLLGDPEVLERLAAARTLLAFDFDGTLAPIVATREHAALRPATAALFEQVCRRYPTAVISGRSRRDVRDRLGNASVKYVVGNHGLEATATVPGAAALHEARVSLTRLVERTAGLELEDKHLSLSVHYRRSRHKARARGAVLSTLAGLRTPMRVIPGKCVLNVVLPEAPNKGDALLALGTRQRAELALYVGDDVTDEDVFRIDQPGRVVTVRVGRSITSAARYYLRDQKEIDVLLRRLLELRG